MEVLDSTHSNQCFLTDQLISYFREMAKWAKFLSILGFILCGLMLLGALGMGAAMSQLSNSGLSSQMTSMLGFVYFVMCLIYFLPTLFLYQFATKTIKALDSSNMSELEVGVGKLKSVFKFWGIFSIVVMSVYALAIIVGVFGGLSAL